MAKTEFLGQALECQPNTNLTLRVARLLTQATIVWRRTPIQEAWDTHYPDTPRHITTQKEAREAAWELLNRPESQATRILTRINIPLITANQLNQIAGNLFDWPEGMHMGHRCTASLLEAYTNKWLIVNSLIHRIVLTPIAHRNLHAKNIPSDQVIHKVIAEAPMLEEHLWIERSRVDRAPDGSKMHPKEVEVMLSEDEVTKLSILSVYLHVKNAHNPLYATLNWLLETAL